MSLGCEVGPETENKNNIAVAFKATLCTCAFVQVLSESLKQKQRHKHDRSSGNYSRFRNTSLTLLYVLYVVVSLCWLFDTELTLANANHAIVIANKPSTVAANNSEANATLNTNKNSPYLTSFHNTLDNATHSIEHKPHKNEITSTSLFANKVITTTLTLATTTLSTANNTALNLSVSRVVHQTHDIPQIPPYIRNTAMSFSIIILLLGVIGNVMVPVVIIRTKDMRNSTNIFLTNLSIADLLVLLVCTPTVLVELNTKPETWALGPEMCKAVPFIELTVAHASVLTILAISFERYYAICEPLKAGYVCTKTRAIIICALAWAVAGSFTSCTQIEKTRPLFLWIILVPSYTAPITGKVNTKPGTQTGRQAFKETALPADKHTSVQEAYKQANIKIRSQTDIQAESTFSPIVWVAEYKYVDYVDGTVVAICVTQAITSWAVAFFLMTISLFFVLPLIILIALYGIIAKRLISNKGLMMRLRPTKPELSLKARNQVVLMLGAVVLSFFLCLLPFRLLTLWIILDSEQSLYAIGIESYYKLLYFCRIMVYLNSAINPILYNLMSTKFRKGFYKLIHTLWNCVFTLISCDQRARRKRSNTNTTTATANTSSNTGTTTTHQNTSSSILSRSSNRCASEDGDTRSRIQLNVQAPFGTDSEMTTMLSTNKDDCPAATLPPFKLCALRKNHLSSPLAAAAAAAAAAASLSQHNNINSQQLKATKQISFEEVVETEANA
uniref:G-protein coupled receptors family 1 profile domain-containing protein n=1 Tax=Glossina austeni TaxID=7395 RepID=A0A1A9UJT0_GLOAU